jgi:hypothetical protein
VRGDKGSKWDGVQERNTGGREGHERGMGGTFEESRISFPPSLCEIIDCHRRQERTCGAEELPAGGGGGGGGAIVPEAKSPTASVLLLRSCPMTAAAPVVAVASSRSRLDPPCPPIELVDPSLAAGATASLKLMKDEKADDGWCRAELSTEDVAEEKSTRRETCGVESERRRCWWLLRRLYLAWRPLDCPLGDEDVTVVVVDTHGALARGPNGAGAVALGTCGASPCCTGGTAAEEHRPVVAPAPTARL